MFLVGLNPPDHPIDPSVAGLAGLTPGGGDLRNACVGCAKTFGREEMGSEAWSELC